MKLRCVARRLGTGLLLMACATALLPAVPLAPSSSLAGRWVNTDIGGSAPLVLYIDAEGQVLNLLPMPQFGATHHLQGRLLTLTSTAGPLRPDPVPLILTLDGDVLRMQAQAFLKRLDPASAGSDEVQGTWRPLDRSRMAEFWTFRSDGEVIIEVGFPGTDRLSGSKLRLSRGTFTLRRDAGGLNVEGDDKTYRFLRRPWGCFGVAGESHAAECREP